MLRKIIRFVCASIRLLIHLLFSFNREKILVRQGSKLNQFILISSCGSKRRMRFNSLTSGAQSEIDLNHIDYPSHEYIRLMIISQVFYPNIEQEKKILIIGLGGGILPRALRRIHPNDQITIIEIDPIVYQMAKKYFYFKEDSKMKVIISDGFIYLNNLLINEYFHLIYIDAYDSLSSLPNQMKTNQFFNLLKDHLNPNGGFIIFNLVCIYQSYFNIRKKINSIFGLNHLIGFRSNDLLNIILICSTFSYSIENFSFNLNLIQQLKTKLSIDFYSLLKTKQKQEESSIDLTTDLKEENLSLKQFVNLV